MNCVKDGSDLAAELFTKKLSKSDHLLTVLLFGEVFKSVCSISLIIGTSICEQGVESCDSKRVALCTISARHILTENFRKG